MEHICREEGRHSAIVSRKKTVERRAQHNVKEDPERVIDMQEKKTYTQLEMQPTTWNGGLYAPRLRKALAQVTCEVGDEVS